MNLKAPQVPKECFELSCGATLLVSRRPNAPVCAAQVHIRGGHSLDKPGLEGTGFLAGRLIDQGTKQHSEEEFAATLENAGGSITGGSTGVSGTIAGDNWKALLSLMAEGLMSPTYPKKKIERQQARVLDRLLVEKDDPRSRGAWLFRGLVYGDHWMGRPEYGNVESVTRITRKDLVDFHRRNWVARRAVIAFCGDVEPKKVKRFLERELSKWKSGSVLGPRNMEFPSIEPREAVFEAQRQQVHLYLGHLGICRSDPDYPALVVMDHVLGTGPGFTNRISKKLRDEQGLAYTVSAAIHNSAGVLPGTFTAYIGTSPEHLDKALAGFLSEIKSIQEDPVSREELELAKNYLTGSVVLGFERAGRRVHTMISAYRNDLPDDHLTQLVQRISEVTVDDVRRVAAKHLFPERASVVASGPVQFAHLERALGRARKPKRRAKLRA